MGLNHDKLQEKRTRGGGAGWKPQPGNNKVRILPPTSRYFDEDIDHIAIKYTMHFFRVEGRQTETSLCLEHIGKKCPACDVWRRFRKADDPGLAQMAKDVSPADKYLFNILDCNNYAGGIQVWDSNWTCWDGIMEIAATPAWGDVLDPENGVDFVVNLTPANSSRSGYNSYKVTPDPNRTNVLPVLEQVPNWKAALDQLGNSQAEPKEAAEIVSLLNEMGFPVGNGGGGGAPAPSPAPAPAPSAPQAAPQPSAPAATPSPGAPPPNAGGGPTPAPAAEAAPSPTPTAQPAAVGAAGADGPPEGAPEGAPNCFGQYDPQTYPCPSCDFIAECQMKNLGLEI